MLKLMTQQLRRSTFHSKTFTSAVGNEVTKTLNGWEQKLKDAGVGNVPFNLKCLVAKVLDVKFNKLSDYDKVKFTPAQLAEFERLCEARCARMPLQHILGEWDFMNITLKTAPTVFIPRPETEEFVHKVIQNYRNVDKPIEMLEVCCGSGAMSLAILHELPGVRSTAIERSKAATKLAWENAKMLGLQERFAVYNHTMETDQYLPTELADKKYDLIIGNPPYVRTGELQLLQPEVLVYENLNSLDGGPDGLRIARLVFELACRHLHPAGKLWLELGSDHPPLVKTIMNLQYEGRLRFITGYTDQYQRDRFVEIEKV